MDASQQGRTGEPFEMVVEVGKLREFARATLSSHPAYARDDAPTPVTFLMSSAFWKTPESSPWGDHEPDLARLLHGEQEFVFHGEPPKVGDRLTGVTRIDKVYEKEGARGGSMIFIEAVTEYRSSRSGALVAEVRATSIETSKPATASS